MYERLIEYEKEHHNANVPQNYDLDTKVGLWVMRQRNTYNNNKLLDEYTSLLNSIGFVWSMRRGNRTTTSTIPLSSRRKKFCAPEDADSITTAEITSTTIAVPTAVIRFHRLCLHLHLLLEVRSLMMSVAITMMTTTTYNTKMSLMSIIIRTNVFMLWQQQVMNIYLQFDISYRHHHHHHIKLNDFIYIGG